MPLEVRSHDTATRLKALSSAESSDSRSLRCLIIYLQGQVSIRQLNTQTALILGRGDDVDQLIDDPEVSRRHLSFQLTQEKVIVEDLKSRNGTYVNEVPIQGPREIQASDVIRIGSTEIMYFSGTPSAYQALLSNPPLAMQSHPKNPHSQAVVVDAEMKKVYDLADRLASVNTTVLILGETGVGKELIAQRLHQSSPRSTRPFVRLNCASLPDNLLESELFGYERGAFTGAERRKIGHIESADSGTLFLDEIGELSASMQAKLLSVLENRCIMRLGGNQEIPVDIRVVCATHRDLESEVKKVTFRRDLYYRISTFVLKIPPLRNRRGEISAIASHFANLVASRIGRPTPSLTPEALRALESHSWPGNVRELRNAIEHAVFLSTGNALTCAALPESLSIGTTTMIGRERGQRYRARVEDTEREEIERALAAENGNRTKAAERLGMSRRTLAYKLARYRTQG